MKKKGLFSRIGLLNRGEPAIRFIQAVRDLNREKEGNFKVIAFYTDPDKNSLYTVRADESCPLGPAQVTDPHRLDERGLPGKKSAYLDYQRIEELLREWKIEALWPGWGFAAEDPAFARLCENLGIVFIGPPSSVMEKLGDKISSKLIAEKAGALVIPWSSKEVETWEEARDLAKSLKYPLALKASAGGGGRGIRIVEKEPELREAYETARSEARKAFGDDRLFLEKLLPKARHIEVQIAADAHGTVWSIGVRDCSVQRRNQKIIEEAPSPVLSPQEEKKICQAAVAIAKKAGYQNLGTAEFLYCPGEKKFYFMEMNTRLQVEHPITEEITGLDLVKLQLRLALGEKLPPHPPGNRGHAIEVRLNAEDPEQGFAPTPGRIITFSIPTGPGIRFDTGIREGDKIPLDFDSMIAKIITYGDTREEARARMDRALFESVILIEEGTTNKGFLLEVLRHPEFQKGTITTGWLDGLQKQKKVFEKKHPHLALLCAALAGYEKALKKVKDKFFLSAYRGQPALDLPSKQGQKVSLSYEQNVYDFWVCKIDTFAYRLYTQENKWLEVEYRKTGKKQYVLVYEGEKYQITSFLQKKHYLVEVEGVSYRISGGVGGAILSPMPAIVLKVDITEGAMVKKGQKIATLEAMKMEMPIYSSLEGKVKKVLVHPNAQVGAGDPLVVMEEEGKSQKTSSKKALSFSTKSKLTSSDTPGCLSLLRELKRLFLGYDMTEDYIEMVLQKLKKNFQKGLSDDSSELIQGLKELLEIYLSVEVLFQKVYLDAEKQDPPLSPKTHLFLYLNWFQAEGEGLPPHFIEKLKKALEYYQITSLKPRSELQSALVYLFQSHHQVRLKHRVVGEILGFFLQEPHLIQRTRRKDLRHLINQITQLCQDRDPGLYNLGRQVLYTLFDSRYLKRRWEKILYRVDETLEKLEKVSSDAEKATHIAWLVNVAPSLVVYLSTKLSQAPHFKPAILEVITRRLYRHYHLHNLYIFGSGEESRCVVTIEEGKDAAQVVVQHGPYRKLAQALKNLEPLSTQLEQPRIVTDIILSHEKDLPREKEEKYIRQTLEENTNLAWLERICVMITSPEETLRSYTFLRKPQDPDQWEEVGLLRDIHPSVNRRLELWRFDDFHMERLPSKEEIYVFKGRSKANEKDERIFVIGEIRDLAPIRNRSGIIVQLPHVENVIFESFEAIREELSKRENPHTLNWNRLIIYIWPPVLIKKKEVEGLVRRLSPFTEGLELEKVVFRAKLRESPAEIPKDTVLQIRPGQEMPIVYKEPDNSLIKPMRDYSRKVLWAKQRGLVYPYELVKMITPSSHSASEFPPGQFQEYDLAKFTDTVKAEPVERPYGENSSNIVFGIITNYTEKHPEGMKRVLILGDSTRAMGSLAEPECTTIIAALDLAEREKLPVEWYAVSSGAKISMDSGTENLDWTARVLRRIIEFTQQGGTINLIVDGINVGAQSYWNAEATMMMHNRGCLIMTPKGTMVLTGKQALDYSGGVSAEDNIGIGGFERIMGPNGQAHYYAKNLLEAYQILFQFYEYTYIAPGEALPRIRESQDSQNRNICKAPYSDELKSGFSEIGEIFDEEKNRGRKKPFDIRQIMIALRDEDSSYLERWPAMKNAEVTVVADTHIGGYPTCLIGIESKHLSRFGHVPSDGPEVWTGGTLFPRSSKKLARALNSADQNRPVVILANLSGFDGSPESLRKLQLEYGAEIGRAVVNYRGPLILFCIIARYHGGAYVVFSRTLNERLQAVAVKGSYASVIGGAPAAAVVFPRQVRSLVLKDKRINKMREAIQKASPSKKALLEQEYLDLYEKVYTEKLGEVASQFDGIHTVGRAKRVGSLDEMLSPEKLRPYIIENIKKACTLYAKGGSKDETKNPEEK